MTELEWFTCENPASMLYFLQRNAMTNERKLRLFACACCRRLWRLLVHETSRSCVELAERFADGRSSIEEMREARLRNEEQAYVPQGPCGAWHLDFASDAAGGTCFIVDPDCPVDACVNTVQVAEELSKAVTGEKVYLGPPWGSSIHEEPNEDEQRAQAELLREVIGNPFSTAEDTSTWYPLEDSTIRNLADSIYAEDAFDRLPILADALEEVGCDNRELLRHLRKPWAHVRGCWALDLIRS